MNCLECQQWLQRRLDGEVLPACEAVEQHCSNCATCRELHAAAGRLLEGMKQLPRPKPASGFAQALTASILQDRKERQMKLRRRVIATMALAASVLVLLLAGYYLIPRSEQPPEKGPLAEDKKQEQKAPETKHARTHEPGQAIAALTERWVGTTRDQATVVLAATNLDAVENLPAVKDLPPLDAGVREAGQEVSDGVRTITRNTRRAFDFFTRELPMPEIVAQQN